MKAAKNNIIKLLWIALGWWITSAVFSAPTDVADALRQRYAELKMQIEYHDTLYFKRNQAQISDQDYDALKQEWRKLGKQLGLDEPDSFVDDSTLQRPKIRHRSPMLSLEKRYSAADIRQFNQQLMQQLQTKQALEYLIEPKIDGVAINLYYQQGRLIYAASRGNGALGEDLTAQVKQLKMLPLQISAADFPSEIELRGEIFVRFSTLQQQGLQTLPRSYAAGSIRLNDLQQVQQRKLQIVIHGWGWVENPPFSSQQVFQQKLQQWGFPGLTVSWKAHGVGEIEQVLQQWDQQRKAWDIPTDGAVIKLNRVVQQKRVGQSDFAPRWAAAYKYLPQQATTQIQAITLQVGRSGRITPVAELQPVVLEGSQIQRISLHNTRYIREKDIRLHDVIRLQKSNEIIPQLVDVDRTQRSSDSVPFDYAQQLQRQGIRAQQRTDGEWWAAGTSAEQQTQRLLHFAQALQIRYLGKATIRQLVEAKVVWGPLDFYRISTEELIALPRWQQKSAQRLIQSIEQSRQAEWWRWLHGFGLPRIGSKGAQELAQQFSTWRSLRVATTEDFQRIQGIGPRTGQLLVDFFAATENQAWLDAAAAMQEE